MKKVTMGLAALALIFASCATDETTSVNKNNPDAIGFSASTGKTRATSNDLAALKASTTGFGVYATNGSTPTEFINNENYKWNSSESAWEWAGDDQMWPTTEAGYPVNFYAYYPDNSDVTDLDVAAMTKSITIETDPDDQIDYLSAKTENVVSRPMSSKVDLDFKHMLSKVDFKVLTGAAVTVEVQSIKVKNVFGTRTFNYQTQAWLDSPVATDNQSYTYATSTDANTFIGAATAAAVTTATGSIMAMPQDLSGRAWVQADNAAGGVIPTSSQSYIEVVYRVLETGGADQVGYTDATKYNEGKTKDYDWYYSAENTEWTDEVAPTGSLFVKVAYPLPTVWAMGYAYTYTIYLGTAAATGGYLIDGYFIDDAGETTLLPVIHPQDPNPDPDPLPIPDPINDTDLPIGFYVDVDAWTDNAGINLE